MRVVSTSPSSTEITYALGVEPVAVSHACDFPPEARGLPTIDVSKVDAESSADRHAQVQAATADGHLYRMDADVIDALEPDLIVTQGVCGVCAVDDVLVAETCVRLESDPTVLSLQARTLGDVFKCIIEVGVATNTQEEAVELVSELRGRLADVEGRLPSGDRPRTAVLEWMDPIRPGGSWIPAVVAAAGGDYGLCNPGGRSEPLEWGAFRAYDPEVIVVAPCGYDVDRTRRQFHELSGRQGWDDITAVRQGRVYALDGSAYLTRWTPRLVDGVERLARCFHPSVFGSPEAVDGVHQIRSRTG